jgi:hypothetical protein
MNPGLVLDTNGLTNDAPANSSDANTFFSPTGDLADACVVATGLVATGLVCSYRLFHFSKFKIADMSLIFLLFI